MTAAAGRGTPFDYQLDEQYRWAELTQPADPPSGATIGPGLPNPGTPTAPAVPAGKAVHTGGDPSTTPPLSDYHIEDVRWSEMAPIDPAAEQFVARGSDRELIALQSPGILDPLPAPADLRPAVAHTPAYATRDEYGGLSDVLAGSRPQIERQYRYPQVGSMLPDPVMVNLARNLPEKYQTGRTVGTPGAEVAAR